MKEADQEGRERMRAPRRRTLGLFGGGRRVLALATLCGLLAASPRADAASATVSLAFGNGYTVEVTHNSELAFEGKGTIVVLPDVEYQFKVTATAGEGWRVIQPTYDEGQGGHVASSALLTFSADPGEVVGIGVTVAFAPIDGAEESITEEAFVTMAKDCPTLDSGHQLDLSVLTITLNEEAEGRTADDPEFCRYTVADVTYKVRLSHASSRLGVADFLMSGLNHTSMTFDYNEETGEYKNVSISFAPDDPASYVSLPTDQLQGIFRTKISGVEFKINPAGAAYELEGSAALEVYLEEDMSFDDRFTILHKESEFGEGGEIVPVAGAENFTGVVRVTISGCTDTADAGAYDWDFQGVTNLNAKFTRPAYVGEAAEDGGAEGEDPAQADLLLLQGDFSAEGVLTARATTGADAGPWDAQKFKATLKSGSTASVSYDLPNHKMGFLAADVDVHVTDIEGLNGTLKFNVAYPGGSAEAPVWVFTAAIDEDTDLQAFGFTIQPGTAGSADGEGAGTDAELIGTFSDDWELSTIIGSNIAGQHNSYDALVKLCQFEIDQGKLTKLVIGDSHVGYKSGGVTIKMRILEAVYGEGATSCTPDEVIEKYVNEDGVECTLVGGGDGEDDPPDTALSVTAGIDFEMSAGGMAHIKFKDYTISREGFIDIGYLEAKFANDNVDVGFKAAFADTQFDGCFNGELKMMKGKDEKIGLNGSLLIGVANDAEGDYLYGLFSLAASTPDIPIIIPVAPPIDTGTKLTKLGGRFGWHVKADELCSFETVGPQRGFWQFGLEFGLTDKASIVGVDALGIVELGAALPTFNFQGEITVQDDVFVGTMSSTFDLNNGRILGNLGAELTLPGVQLGGNVVEDDDGNLAVTDKANQEFLFDIKNDAWKIASPGPHAPTCPGDAGNPMKGLLLNGLISIRGDALLEGNFDGFEYTTGNIKGRAALEVSTVKRYPDDFRPWIKLGRDCSSPDVAADCTADRDEAGLNDRPPPDALCLECSNATATGAGFGVLFSANLQTRGTVEVDLDEHGPTGTFGLAILANADGVLNVPGSRRATSGRIQVTGDLVATITQPTTTTAGSCRIAGILTYSTSATRSYDHRFDETFIY